MLRHRVNDMRIYLDGTVFIYIYTRVCLRRGEHLQIATIKQIHFEKGIS